MSLGRVYIAQNDSSEETFAGQITAAVVPLAHLEPTVDGRPALAGRFVRVHQAGEIMVPSEGGESWKVIPLGDAKPDEDGNFLFTPGRGGGRMDKALTAPEDFRWRYTQAAHFGEVNTYFHLDRIATYVDDLLSTLGVPSLPPVVARVNAHHAATEQDGMRDGVHRNGHWRAFQGGHYRLPSRRYDVAEHLPLSSHGEIHLGPGWRLTEHGGLPLAAGGRYRANASHNAGIIYHEYGHHMSRHTADFKANALRNPERQNNRKTAMDEGTCDYWAAVMLGTPHIWYLHRRHDDGEIHPRSLVSSRTMADFNSDRKADPHVNGTIWAAALWDLRTELSRTLADGGRTADLLVLKALLLIGQNRVGNDVLTTRLLRKDFAAGLSALIQADAELHRGEHERAIRQIFDQRGIQPGEVTQASTQAMPQLSTRIALRNVAAEEIPPDGDILSADAAEQLLAADGEVTYSIIVAGDIMLGGRSKLSIATYGSAYPFAAVLPLLKRSPIVLGNLEGPFARRAQKVDRTYSYRVRPSLAPALLQAGINVVTLANNHLMDCGREGIVETLETLEATGIVPLGAGRNESEAHRAVVMRAGELRVGLLGYYWNRRCAATKTLPGSATDTREELAADISAVRSQVDRLLVTFHWGIPYEPEPLSEDREKARFAIDCGADAVVGHHPHIAQPVEVYHGRPIIYSVGNFTFGSGNSQGEGLLAAISFKPGSTLVDIYPMYVKNRDPRVSYQPKLLQGESARRILRRIAEASGESAAHLQFRGWFGRLSLPS